MPIDNIHKFLDFLKKNMGQLDENKTHLVDLIQLNNELIESLANAKIQVPEWKSYLSSLINKIIITSFSTVELTKGKDINDSKNEYSAHIIDYSSIFILTRAIIENYLTLNYIYFNSLPEDEKHFRFLLWEVSGLVSRQQYEPKNKQFKAQRVKEKRIIDDIKRDIKLLPEFKRLRQAHIKKLEQYGLPRIESWHKLLEVSDLNNIFASSYSLFSSYAHSEFISILQLKKTSLNSNNKIVQDHVTLCIMIIKVVNCLVIKHLMVNFKTAEIIYNTKSENLKSSIEMWIQVSQFKAP